MMLSLNELVDVLPEEDEIGGYALIHPNCTPGKERGITISERRADQIVVTVWGDWMYEDHLPPSARQISAVGECAVTLPSGSSEHKRQAVRTAMGRAVQNSVAYRAQERRRGCTAHKVWPGFGWETPGDQCGWCGAPLWVSALAVEEGSVPWPPNYAT